MGDRREDRELIEEIGELTAALAILIELLSNPIMVQVVNSTGNTPTTIVLVPGTPRPN